MKKEGREEGREGGRRKVMMTIVLNPNWPVYYSCTRSSCDRQWKEGRKEDRKARRQKGRKTGRQEGRQAERKEGRKEGRKKERIEARKNRSIKDDDVCFIGPRRVEVGR